MSWQEKEKSYSIGLSGPHINQKTVLKSKARYRICATGRRFGKTFLSRIAATLRLFKGEHVWFCSPTNTNSKRVFRDFVNMFKEFPEDIVKINRTDMRIDLLFNDAWIEFKSLDSPDNLRGEGLNFVIIDEAAFCQDHIWDEVISPMLLSDKGEALFISSTNGRNWFWRMYGLGLDDENTDYESFHYTSYDNPLIDPKDIDELRKRTPKHVFDREYMAVFEKDGGSVFRNISGCLRIHDGLLSGLDENNEFVLVTREENTQENLEEKYIEKMLGDDNRTIVLSIDWGQMNDYTVICVLDLNTRSLIEYSRINKVAWKDIRGEVTRLYEKWNPVTILAEENNATANIEELQDEGLPVEGFKTTSKSKPIIINHLSLAVENGDISLPDDKTLISELSAFSMTQTTFGNIKYSAPPGLHDDIVMSLAIGWSATELILLPDAFKVVSV